MQTSNNNNNTDEVAKCIRDAAQCHSYTVSVLKLNVVVRFDSHPLAGSNRIREQAALVARLPSLNAPTNDHGNGQQVVRGLSRSSSRGLPSLPSLPSLPNNNDNRNGQQVVKQLNYVRGLHRSSMNRSSSRGSSSRGSPALLNTSSVHHYEAPELLGTRR